MAAVLVCPRCGGFACGACAVTLVPPHGAEPRRVCLACRPTEAERLAGEARRPSARAGVVFWLGLLSPFPPFALLSLVLGALELRAIRRGRAPRAGLWWTVSGMAVALLLGGLLLVALLPSRIR